MKKFFKMKNLVKKIILILQNFFWKIVEKLKKKSFGNIQNRSKLPNLAKKIPIVVLIYILKKKRKNFRHGFGVIFTFWKEDLKKKIDFNQKL